MVTGQVSGMVVIDVDKGEGVDRFGQWGLHERAHVRTPSGGLHWYLKHPGWPVKTVQSQTNHRLESIRGIDVRGDGGYVVIPPTCFGKAGYQALRDHHDLDDAAWLPQDVQDLLGLRCPPMPQPTAPLSPQRSNSHPQWKAKDGTTLERELLFLALELAHSEGRRNETGFWLACQLRDNRFSQIDAELVMRDYAQQVPGTNSKGEAEAYTFEEAQHSLEQAYSRAARAPWRAPAATLLGRLEEAWPSLGPLARLEAARCVVGARGPVRAEGVSLLRKLGFDGLEDVMMQLEAEVRSGVAVPGSTALHKLLRAQV
ncbi:bifunctional DNA primase/polymerase [Deinococcus multiflagellatus]|uniref:Bifunctional DNA primase/polymerase n=1 Tax=Deinococcus multiflagellatus TaxID=1656887 RepID=A0ABW1ZPU1_9DEIO